MKLPNMRACQCGGLCTVQLDDGILKVCCVACLTGRDIETTPNILILVDAILSSAKEIKDLEAQLSKAKLELQDLVR